MSRKRLLVPACLLASAMGASVALAQTPATPPTLPTPPTARAFTLAFGDGNYLGIYTETVTRENMGRYNLSGEPRGVGVTQVAENSPAAKAGLQKGDVILAFDGEQVASAQKLQRLINESAPEHAARLTISRAGSERELNATLGKRDAPGSGFNALRMEDGNLFRWDGKDWQKQSQDLSKQSEEWRKNSGEWRKQAEEMRRQLEKFKGPGGNFALAFNSGRRIGVTTTTLTDQLADYFGVSREGGVLVTSVLENSPAAKAGLKAGDIVTEVDGERVKSAADLSRLVSRKTDGDVSLSVTRERKTRNVRVTPEKSSAPNVWTTPEGLFDAPGALALPSGALALPDGAFVLRPSALGATRLRAFPSLPTLPRINVPATPLLRARPLVRVGSAQGQLMEL